MKRTICFYLCAALFLLLTGVKLISPAAAAEVRDTLLPVIDRDDDLQSAVQTVRRALDRSVPAGTGASLPIVPPLTQLQQQIDAARDSALMALPEAQSPNPTPTPAPDPETEAAMAVRDAFLSAQAAFSDYSRPENVSYDLLSLPFSKTAPVAGMTSSGFGYRLHPIQDVVKFHYGTDYAADEGTDVFAFADGTVLAAGEDEGYGNYVKLDHGDGFVTLYGHCSALLVSAGDTVAKGQVIARVGATGQATGPHLHFELMHDGVYLNPEFYLAA